MELLGEDLDAMMTLGFQADPWRRNIKRLYTEARSRVGRPLTVAAAEGLKKAVRPGSTVIITTGFVTPLWFPHGENDGPIGAVVLARALQSALQARIVLLAEEPITSVLNAATEAAGLATFEWSAAQHIPLSTAVGSFPIDEQQSQSRAVELLDGLRPAALVATEKSGRNVKGVYHTGYGYDILESTAKIDYLFDTARRRGVFTVGVGDLGNEIGMGGVAGPLRDLIPNGARCKCGCGAGIVTVTEADVPIPAATCDWGVYAVAAAVSALLEVPDALVEPELLESIVQACLRGGSRDGITMLPVPKVDGMPMSVHASYLELLRALVRIRGRRTPLQEFRKAHPHLPSTDHSSSPFTAKGGERA